MQRDIREASTYRDVEALHVRFRQPQSGRISDAAEPTSNGALTLFAGTIVEELAGSLPLRLCCTDHADGSTRVLTSGPNTDRSPKFSPDGKRAAFLSDRGRVGDFQLYLLDIETNAQTAAPRVDGWVEYLHWSPDGRQILLGVAGHGADVAAGVGAVTTKTLSAAPSWSPRVESSAEDYRWRRVWIYDLATDEIHLVGPHRLNVWEAAWCGSGAIALIASEGPSEGLWYAAALYVMGLGEADARKVYAAPYQLGAPAGAPAGDAVAVLEAVCSDRGIVAGDVVMIMPSSGASLKIDTNGVDVAYMEWRSGSVLLLAGHRGFETVVGVYDTHKGVFRETWSSEEITTGGRYVAVAGLGAEGDFVLVGEGFHRAPEIALVRGGRYQTTASFDLGYAEAAKAIGAVEKVAWRGRDGLEIQGWLLRPEGEQPHPLIMNIHGGPVWHWRPTWLGRGGAPNLMLVQRGYAVFFPNPRGSSGRGQAFVRSMIGDLGGGDAQDCLSGLDHLVAAGLADPQRLGITGGSYGGFMTSWLITQDARFRAAAPLAPITNFVSEHLTSNLPQFVSLFLGDRYADVHGRYVQRSPIMHADKVKTPTLNICGALDRCTPPGEALQFHNALLEHGVESVLVTYPEEGHGVRQWPAIIDYHARMLMWFDEHLGAGGPSA